MECLDKIKSGIFTHREKQHSRSSRVWDFFHEIVDDSGRTVEEFYFCIECETVLHFARLYGSTSQLLRHSCVAAASINEIIIHANDIERIERAAAKFVCIDLRPFNAVECSGLRELILAGVELGKKYPTMKTDDFLHIFPSRKTVKTIITKEATFAKDVIKSLFKEAIKQNGLGCTLDLWTDKFKSNSYMAMTANMFLIRETGIEQKGIVFHMGYVDDIVKSKQVIKSRIIQVFDGFEVSTQQLKDYVTFTTDR